MTLVTTPVATKVIGCAITVHRSLGPGLFESVYEPCLAHEMRKAGLQFKEQALLPVNYDGLTFGKGFVADFIVEDEVIVELKSIDKLLPVHGAQVLTYLRLTGLRKGLLINFNVSILKYGVKSYVM
jgi:GxxExxY protein